LSSVAWFLFSSRATRFVLHLKVGRTEPPPLALVVQHLDLKGKVLAEVLREQDKVG